MFLYCFARPNQMVDHRFTDDVAICRAWSKKAAIKKFSVLYAGVEEKEVSRINHFKNVKILTDY